jgi:hypothetical protein
VKFSVILGVKFRGVQEGFLKLNESIQRVNSLSRQLKLLEVRNRLPLEASPAAAVSTAAAAIATAAVPSTAAAALTLGTGTSLAHHDIFSHQLRAIQSSQRRLRLSLIRHFHESKSPGFTAKFIADDGCGRNFTERLKGLLEIGFRYIH